jgi:hypothetical protein
VRGAGSVEIYLERRRSAANLRIRQIHHSSRTVAGEFAKRVTLHKTPRGRNVGAGFLTFSEMLKQCENSSGHREAY